MLLPGLGSARISPSIRLFIAIAVSFAIVPLMWDVIVPKVSVEQHTYLGLIFAEVVIGAVFGLIARFFVLALEFGSSAMAMVIGMSAMPSSDVMEETVHAQLATFIGMVAIIILFTLDFHHVVLQALIMSYQLIPMGSGVDVQLALVTLVDTLQASFTLVLKLISPFIIYGLVFNVSIGLVNKLAPQIPIYFISVPFILTGGLLLFYLASNDFFSLFGDAFVPIFLGQNQ